MEYFFDLQRFSYDDGSHGAMDKPQHVLPVWCRKYLDSRVVRNVVGVIDIGDHKMFEPHDIPGCWRTFRVKVRCSIRDADAKSSKRGAIALTATE